MFLSFIVLAGIFCQPSCSEGVVRGVYLSNDPPLKCVQPHRSDCPHGVAAALTAWKALVGKASDEDNAVFSVTDILNTAKISNPNLNGTQLLCVRRVIHTLLPKVYLLEEEYKALVLYNQSELLPLDEHRRYPIHNLYFEKFWKPYQRDSRRPGMKKWPSTLCGAYYFYKTVFEPRVGEPIDSTIKLTTVISSIKSEVPVVVPHALSAIAIIEGIQQRWKFKDVKFTGVRVPGLLFVQSGLPERIENINYPVWRYGGDNGHARNKERSKRVANLVNGDNVSPRFKKSRLDIYPLIREVYDLSRSSDHTTSHGGYYSTKIGVEGAEEPIGRSASGILKHRDDVDSHPFQQQTDSIPNDYHEKMSELSNDFSDITSDTEVGDISEPFIEARYYPSSGIFDNSIDLTGSPDPPTLDPVFGFEDYGDDFMAFYESLKG